MDAEWWSIEVFNADLPASVWFRAWREQWEEAALTHGALAWNVSGGTWGLVFEISFRDEADWLRWRGLPVVRAALDAVPDPVNGLVVYRGRGGSSASPVPRRPRPAPGAAAVELDEKPEDIHVRLDGDPDPVA